MTKGWRTGRLIDFASVSTGPFGSLLHKSDYVSDGVPLVNPINIVGERIVPDPEKRIDKKTVSRLASYVLRQGDIVVSRRGELGRCAAIGPDEAGWVCGTGCFFIRPGSGIESRFLAAMLRSDRYRAEMEAASTGATMPSVSNTTLSNLLVTVPERNEQRRIVAILDEAFAGIATARANAEKNIKNSRDSLEAYLETIFASRKPGWIDRKMSSLCRDVTVGYVGPMKSEYVLEGVPFLRSQNIRPFEISLDNLVFVRSEFHRGIAKSRLGPGDLAIVRTGYPGTAAVIPDSLAEANCSDLVIMRPGPEVNPNFLAAFFNSAFGKRMVMGKLVGAAQKHFNVGAAKDVVLHLPSMEEQDRIVAGIAEIRAETGSLESLHTRKLAALDELRKSLLQQAFSGQL